LVPVFYALNNPTYPVLGSFLAVGTNFLLVVLTLAPLQHRAIALATSLSMTLNFAFLSLVLYRVVQSYPLGRLFTSLAKICLAASGMGTVVYFLAAALHPALQAGLASRLAALLIIMAAGLAVYTTSIHFLQIAEFDMLTAKLRQRLGRGRP
jgi:putative peptidoglycan lipid II flippase